jgi:Ca2+-transporting ATPase
MASNWYQLPSADIFAQLNSAETGLESAEALRRLEVYGPNRLEEERRRSRLSVLVAQFANPLIYIILIAAVVTLFFRDYVDAIVILIVVLLNAIIGYVQEYKAEDSVHALKKLVVPRSRVLRDSREREVDSDQLVPGDVVLLASGARVPADLRLFETIELHVEEAALTGESLPAEKLASPIAQDNLTPGDQRNMAFAGTIVVRGRGTGIVVATGRDTILGQIAREVQTATGVTSPLQAKMARFARLLGLLSAAGTALIVILDLLLGTPAPELIKTAVATMVAAIPEALPVVVTVTLAVGVGRMAQRNAVIRRLPAVETLGSTTVICSDKTGTLTRNEMTVRAIYDGEHTYEVTGSGYQPLGEVRPGEALLDPQTSECLQMILRIGLLCNESSVVLEDGHWVVRGDPTEGALIVAAMKAGMDVEQESATFRRVDYVPFESERGYMATLHQRSNRKWIFVKGAPEKVIELCTRCAATEAWKGQEVLHAAQRFAQQGMRVLAFAFREAPPDMEGLSPEDVEGQLTLAGLQGMIDPPRPEAITAVAGCKRAGIRVIMITGDHATTALAIARAIGIAEEGDEALTGRELEALDDEALYERVRDVSVFARVSPQHKLRIVQQIKRRGEIVAVTGDGVNDAPALKAAHIGVAMGITGTDVAKETADMVVADDNFASIFSAVEEGRVVFDNIRKVTLFLVPAGIAAILATLLAKVLRLPTPYAAVQMLWVNLVTSGLQDVALAFEPAEAGILGRPPRDPAEGVMSRLMVRRSVLVGVFIAVGAILNFVAARNAGYALTNARTMVMTTTVFFQFFQAWNSRSERESIFRIGLFSNPLLLFAVVAAVAAQLAVLYVPVLQSVFQTVPLTASEWLGVLAVSATVVPAVELDKLIQRRQEPHLPAQV